MNKELISKGASFGIRGFALYTTLPFLFVGGLLMLIAVFWLIANGQQFATWQKVPAEVIAIDGGTAVVRYTDVHSGDLVEARSNSSISPSPYAIGEQVDAYVSQDDPTVVAIDSFTEAYGFPIGLGLFGLFMAGIAGFVLKAVWKTSDVVQQAIDQAMANAEGAAAKQPPLPPAHAAPPTSPKDNQGVTWH